MRAVADHLSWADLAGATLHRVYRGDLNGDGVLDARDVAILATALAEFGGVWRWEDEFGAGDRQLCER